MFNATCASQTRALDATLSVSSINQASSATPDAIGYPRALINNKLETSYRAINLMKPAPILTTIAAFASAASALYRPYDDSVAGNSFPSVQRRQGSSGTPTLVPPIVPTGVYTVREPSPTTQSRINYNGGNVMANGVNIYGIFYGTHSQNTQDIVARFVTGLGGSDWWGVVKTYTGSNGAINGNVKWVGAYVDNYSLGKTLKFGAMDKIIDAAITASKWPKDPNGIYVVFTAPDVSESSSNGGYCKDYCGYHGITRSSNLKMNMIGDATSCPGTLPPPGGLKGTPGCLQRYYRNQTDPTYSINRNQNADSMVEVLSHEIAETASDYANSWRDIRGYENGDKCASFLLNVQGASAVAPDVYQSPFNNVYNVDFGAYGKYLIQSMWSATSQTCLMKQT